MIDMPEREPDIIIVPGKSISVRAKCGACERIASFELPLHVSMAWVHAGRVQRIMREFEENIITTETEALNQTQRALAE